MLQYGQDYIDIGEKAYEAQFEARRLASLKEATRRPRDHGDPCGVAAGWGVVCSTFTQISMAVLNAV